MHVIRRMALTGARCCTPRRRPGCCCPAVDGSWPTVRCQPTKMSGCADISHLQEQSIRLACRERWPQQGLFLGVGPMPRPNRPGPPHPLIRHVTFLRRTCSWPRRGLVPWAGSGASLDPANTKAEQFALGLDHATAHPFGGRCRASPQPEGWRPRNECIHCGAPCEE